MIKCNNFLNLLQICYALSIILENNYLVITKNYEEKKMSTLEKVRKVVVDQLSVDEALVTPEASFTADLGADSLDTVELVMAFEEEFGCEIPDEEAEKIQTVQDAVNYIDSHK